MPAQGDTYRGTVAHLICISQAAQSSQYSNVKAFETRNSTDGIAEALLKLPHVPPFQIDPGGGRRPPCWLLQLLLTAPPCCAALCIRLPQPVRAAILGVLQAIVRCRQCSRRQRSTTHDLAACAPLHRFLHGAPSCKGRRSVL